MQKIKQCDLKAVPMGFETITHLLYFLFLLYHLKAVPMGFETDL